MNREWNNGFAAGVFWISLMLAVVLLIYGCATPIQYVLPKDRTEQEFYADSAHCEALARGQHSIYGDTFPVVNRRHYNDCMQGRGWKELINRL